MQFEMNECMPPAGRLNGYCEKLEKTTNGLVIHNHDFEQEVERAEEGLMAMSEWVDSKWDSIIEENKEATESVTELV